MLHQHVLVYKCPRSDTGYLHSDVLQSRSYALSNKIPVRETVNIKQQKYILIKKMYPLKVIPWLPLLKVQLQKKPVSIKLC